MVIHLAHVEHEVTIRKVLLIFGISILHILAGGFDQFVSNVLHGEGRLHQVIIACYENNLVGTKLINSYLGYSRYLAHDSRHNALYHSIGNAISNTKR